MANEFSDPKSLILNGTINAIIDRATSGLGLAWIRDGELDRLMIETGAVGAESLSPEQVFPGDLHDQALVVRLFDQSHQYLAAITARGWRVLRRIYGWETLAEIAAHSSWFAMQEPEEILDSLTYFSRTAGYDPIRDAFGLFDEVAESFTAENGESWSVD